MPLTFLGFLPSSRHAETLAGSSQGGYVGSSLVASMQSADHGCPMNPQARHLAKRSLQAYDTALRAKNRRRPNVLVYTDSRGLNLAGRVTHRHYAGSYVHRLQWRYNVMYEVAPYSHTTILDFLAYAEAHDLTVFDAVVMHCGIVDFSPRPLSDIGRIRAAAIGRPGYEDMFGRNTEWHANPWPVQYAGEPTISLYSPAYLRTILLPRLQGVPNLIWINANRFVPGWEGNHRGRPSNIEQVVSEFDQVLRPALPSVIDLRAWSLEAVQKFTLDNIHLNRAGFRQLTEMVAGYLSETP